MHHSRFALFLILLLSIVCRAPAKPQDIDPTTEQTLKDLNQKATALASAEDDAKKWSEARIVWEDALRKAREANAEEWQARFLGNLGVICQYLNKSDAAAQYFEDGIALTEKWSAPNRSRANLFKGRADFRSYMADYAGAVNDFRAAIALVDAKNDPVLAAKYHANFAGTLKDIGLLNDAENEYKTAELLFIQAQVDPNSSVFAVLYNNLGNLYQSSGNKPAARAMLEKARAIALPLKDKDKEAQSLLPVIYNGLGNQCRDEGNFPKALEWFEKAIAGFKEIKEPSHAAMAVLGEGNVYLTMRRYKTAAAKFAAARRMLDQNVTPNMEVSLLFGEAEAKAHDPAIDINVTLAKMRGAMQEAQKWGLLRETLFIAYTLGVAEEARGNGDAALAAYQTAVDAARRMGAAPSDPQEAADYQETNIGDLYDRLGSLVARRGDAAGGLSIMEKGRCQVLARMVAQSQVKPEDALTATQQDELKRLDDSQILARKREAALAQKAEAGGANRPRAADVAAATTNRVAAGDAWRKAYARALENSPRYHLLKTPPSLLPQDWKTLGQERADTLRVEYALTASGRLTIIAVDARGAQRVAVPKNSDKLAALAAAWRKTLTSPSVAHPNQQQRLDQLRARQEEPPRARALYDILIAPLEAQGLLRGKTRLLIAADGPLLDLPFAALLDHSGGRLIDRLIPAFQFSLSASRWPVSNRPAPLAALCVSDPLGETGKASKTATGLLGTFGPLPETRASVRKIAALFPGSLVLEGGDATRAALLKRIAEARILHFGTHSVLQPDDGLRSALILASERDGTAPYEALEAWEVLRHPLAAHLVTLAACETARGKASGGEGLLGLTWAFRAAGCPHIAASLWKVQDRATGELMRRFYTRLKAAPNAPPDVLMSQAMRDLRRSPEYQFPYYWAGFVFFEDSAS